MTDAVGNGRGLAEPQGARLGDRFGSSYVLAWLSIMGAAVAAAALLTLPIRAPIGAMYWDTFTYYDAAGRILGGQIPVLDFFTPAGPLGYAVAAAWIWAFPNGQPSLLLHWSTLAMSLPLMALVLAGLRPQERPLATWLVLPFLLFSLLPFNGKEFYPFPGSDGFAYYNRQTCLVLFPLVAGLVFVRRPMLLTALVAASMVTLFFLKITGFLAGGLLCLFALAAGRLRVREAVAAALAFAVILVAIELPSRLVSEYLADVGLLLGMNTGSLMPRVVQALSINFGIVASAGLLFALLIAADRDGTASALRRLTRERSSPALAAAADRPAFWLAAVTIAGVAFETQNTGSQAMIFLWPVLLWILSVHLAGVRHDRTAFAVMALVGAVYLPLVVGIGERAARAYVGTVGNVALAHRNLGTLGAVSARPQVVERARTMAAAYAANRAAFEDIAARGEMPSPLLYSDPDFQIMYLTAIDDAIEAIRTLEAQRGARFDVIMSLSFTNPTPWLMNRRAPRLITVGADPYRAVPPLDAGARASVAAADLVLLPTCPPTPAVSKLADHFSEPLAQHRRIGLTPCYDALLHPKFR